jgi:hypothetical protein
LKVVQDTINGEGTQINKWLHKIPLNLQGEIHPLPYISMDKFPMFFENILEDAEKHLIKFESSCKIYNVVENHVACRLFILTLKENASWDVLENLFIDKYVSRKNPYSIFLKLVEIHMSEEEPIKDFTFIFMRVLHDIPQEMFPNDVIISVVMKNPCL